MKKYLYLILLSFTIFCLESAFAQMIVKSSDGQTELMRVDENGNATIAAKTTTVNLSMTGHTPQSGKVPYSIDSAGNLRWSGRPSSSGQFLSWNASTNNWDIADPPVGVPVLRGRPDRV